MSNNIVLLIFYIKFAQTKIIIYNLIILNVYFSSAFRIMMKKDSFKENEIRQYLSTLLSLLTEEEA